MSTAYRARRFAYELTRKQPATHIDRLSISPFNASEPWSSLSRQVFTKTEVDRMTIALEREDIHLSGGG